METFCFEAVAAHAGDDRCYIVYYLGDLDRAGRDAGNSLREKLERLAAEQAVAVEFVHLAINEDDILDFTSGTGLLHVILGNMERRLPTRAPKRNTPADRAWPHPFACELDAIEPDDLRDLVRWVIEQHLSADQLRLLQIAETSERELIKNLVAGITPKTDDGPAQPPTRPPITRPTRPLITRPTR